MLTRLSQIVKSNLERRQVDASYRRSLAGDALEEELQKMSVGGAEEEEGGVSGSMELIVTDKVRISESVCSLRAEFGRLLMDSCVSFECRISRCSSTKIRRKTMEAGK